MNQRQKVKRLKKEITRIKSDNELMRDIIGNSPRMAELYDLYTKPFKNVTYSTMEFEEYRGKRFLPPDRPHDAGFIALYKHALAREMFETIERNIDFEIDTECGYPCIEASIFIGRK